MPTSPQLHRSPRARARLVRWCLVGATAIALAPSGWSAASTVDPADPGAGEERRRSSTKFSFSGDRDHKVVHGRTRTFRPEDERVLDFGVYGDEPDRISVTVDTSDESYYLRLDAPHGESLTPGVYRRAIQGGSQSRSPSMWFDGGDGMCERGTRGSFAIHQIGFDDEGYLVMLDASFHHVCDEKGGPVATGHIHLDRRPLTYSYDSDEGDYIGDGRSETFVNSSSVIQGEGDPTYFSLRIHRRVHAYGVTIEAPHGETFEEGRTYVTARHADDGIAGLDASAEARGCNRSHGELTITRLVVGPDGAPARIRFHFVQHCESADPALRGEVRYLA